MIGGPCHDWMGDPLKTFEFGSLWPHGGAILKIKSLESKSSLIVFHVVFPVT
jgi:hypothetical protein